MKKKLMAFLASTCVLTTGAAIALLPNTETEVSAEANVTAMLDACVDIASDSWVSGGNGWRQNRYGGRSITSEQIGVTLGAYGWADANNSLIWGGGGPSAEGFGNLYTGGDFAVSFAATTNANFAMVVDNYMVTISSSYIKIGYNDRRGVMGDHMMDYHPATWDELYTGSELGGEYASTEAAWLTTQTVALDSVVDVDVSVSTVEGVTTVVARVDGIVVSATSDHARIKAAHPAIVTRGVKIYSQKATQYVDSMDKAVAGLDESVYTGEFKTQVDTAIAEAKESIWGEETLTNTFANEKTSAVLTLINESKYQAMFDSCVDISSDSWVSGGNGWRKGRFGGRSIDSDTIGVTLDSYGWDGTTHWLVWGGGGFDTSSGLYNGGDFAVSFATELTSGGVAVVIDQFSLWLTPTAIKLGYDEHPDVGTFGDGLMDYSPVFWTTDLDILHKNGSTIAQWLVQKDVNFSGLVSVDAYVGTDEAGVTTLLMRVNDTVVTATTERARKTSVHGGIMSQNAKIYSTKYLANKGVSVGDTVYSNLNAAINAAGDNATVTLNDNISETAVTVAEGKNVTVDLNGKNFTASEVAVNGNLTIGGGNATADFVVAGALTMNDGVYTAKETLLTANGGSIVLNGGKFNQSFVYDAVAGANAPIANFVVANGAITLTSGELATVAHANADRSIVRLVAGIDALSYDAVGFEITYNGVTKEVTTQKAFTSFTYGSASITPDEWNANYLFGYNLKEMPAGVTFTVRAFWVAKDTGAKVYGEAVEVAVDSIVLAS